MQKRYPSFVLAAVLALFAVMGNAQNAGVWHIDDNWAQVPGADWGGST